MIGLKAYSTTTIWQDIINFGRWMSSDESLVAGLIDVQQDDKSYVHTKENSISNQGQDPSQEEYDRHNITIHISTMYPTTSVTTIKKTAHIFNRINNRNTNWLGQNAVDIRGRNQQ